MPRCTKGTVLTMATIENYGDLADVSEGRIAADQDQTVRQGQLKIVEAFARTRGDNERGCEGNFGGAVPLTQGQKRVRAHETEEPSAGGKAGAKAPQRVQRVVGPARRIRRVDLRKLKPRLPGDGKFRHAQAVIE